MTPHCLASLPRCQKDGPHSFDTPHCLNIFGLFSYLFVCLFVYVLLSKSHGQPHSQSLPSSSSWCISFLGFTMVYQFPRTTVTKNQKSGGVKIFIFTDLVTLSLKSRSYQGFVHLEGSQEECFLASFSFQWPQAFPFFGGSIIAVSASI